MPPVAMALPDISLLYNYKGAAYPVNLDCTASSACREEQCDSLVPSLVDICCGVIVGDATSTQHVIQTVPTELCYSLMKAAVHGGRDRSIEVLISNWPWDILSLQKFAPCLFDQIKVLHSDGYLNERIRKGVKYTTCLAHTFVECLKKRSPTKLKSLDLSGYPAAEVIVNYMSSHVLLVYNEVRQKEIVSAYNALTKDLPEDRRKQFQLDSTLPDESYVVTMDAFLQTTDTHMELCKALRTSSKPQCRFKLCLNKLDIMCLGLARTSVLLEQVDPNYLTALCLQFNGLCNDALSMLVPGIQRLKQLTALDLSCNSINLGSEGSEDTATNQMASMLSSLPNLRRLDLSNNRTKTKLSRILSGMQRQLEYLKLCGCGLSESDLIFLKNSQHASSLRELDISGNNINRIFQLVLDLLARLQGTLRVLELEECELDTQSITMLFHTAGIFSSLLYLNLSRNRWWTSGVLDSGLLSLVQIVGLQAVRVSYPAECYSLLNPNPDYIEEDILEYTESITARVEQSCERLGRPPLKLVFIP